MDGRKNNWGGARKNSGRKRGIGLSYDIQKYCEEFIEKILEDDKIKQIAIKQLVNRELNEHKRSEKNCVYVIESNGLYKIGFSSDFTKRLSSYNTHTPLNKIICVAFNNNAFDLESELHKKWNYLNVSGEWFNLNQSQLLELLNDINNFCYGRKG